jgi:hypothetical protein
MKFQDAIQSDHSVVVRKAEVQWRLVRRLRHRTKRLATRCAIGRPGWRSWCWSHEEFLCAPLAKQLQ